MSQTAPLTSLKQLIAPMLMFSFVTNLAILVSPIFMMQVLDRVVPSGNLSTLLLLLCLAILITFTHSIVEMYRDMTFDKSARWIEMTGAQSALNIEITKRENIIQNIGHCSAFFRSSQASTALNIPWIPIFLIALSFIHPLFCLLIGGIIACMFTVKVFAKVAIADTQKNTQNVMQKETETLRDIHDNAVISGMRAVAVNLAQLYFSLQSQRHRFEDQTSLSRSAQTASLSFLRTSTQLLALSLGAYLVVNGSLTAGGMIGASIITAKTVSSIESCVNAFKDIKVSLQAYKALNIDLTKPNTVPTEIVSLNGQIKCDGLIFPRGNGAPPRLDRVSFHLDAGQCLAIIGDSGSGKTTLLHALCGIAPCPIGSVILDESEVKTLGPKTLQTEVGYLAQQARIVKGTIAQNISCFQNTPDDEKIIAAAKLAGVHGLISALPQGYDTEMGTQSYLLSAGQKQRVALARAVYESPKYLFLDEPNALLDAVGERQLCDTLSILKKRGTTIIMVLHRSGIMSIADKVLFLDQGRMADFGPRSEVLSRMNDGKQRITLPLQPASLLDLTDWIVAQFVRHSDKAFCQNAVMVANEMFNVADLNGPNDQKRQVTLIFRFIDEKRCEVTLREEHPTRAAQKMQKIRSLVIHPEVSMVDLPDDEIGLAVISQMTDSFDIQNIDNASLFSARLSGKANHKAGVTLQ
ncbi:ATP-binding cassette domain-containing protein [Amylibacter sp. SFDW26]|uniref:ATP-binding cassette domain-containing protein n=1 Tax=Amylibacter sp. SFDW26 TaxID=2652722 RepID=UPI0012617958|nr:ATP-binding cassette domain-containing protein [Amylibacter sp. SFDW26]KAB7615957.1 ATP-binding cassette domain-containing protein [Amylibacter sp. SFDW26]